VQLRSPFHSARIRRRSLPVAGSGTPRSSRCDGANESAVTFARWKVRVSTPLSSWLLPKLIHHR
jgi:hypothetical protein